MCRIVLTFEHGEARLDTSLVRPSDPPPPLLQCNTARISQSIGIHRVSEKWQHMEGICNSYLVYSKTGKGFENMGCPHGFCSSYGIRNVVIFRLSLDLTSFPQQCFLIAASKVVTSDQKHDLVKSKNNKLTLATKSLTNRSTSLFGNINNSGAPISLFHARIIFFAFVSPCSAVGSIPRISSKVILSSLPPRKLSSPRVSIRLNES